MILKAVVNFLWFDIDYKSIQWLIKMNINSCVNKVWTERVDNKFRQQFDKVLEKYQATMHRALSRHPSLFSSPYYFFPASFCCCFFLSFSFLPHLQSRFFSISLALRLFLSLTYLPLPYFYTFLLFIHTRLGFLTQFHHFDTSKHLFTLFRGRHQHK